MRCLHHPFSAIRTGARIGLATRYGWSAEDLGPGTTLSTTDGQMVALLALFVGFGVLEIVLAQGVLLAGAFAAADARCPTQSG